MLSDTTASGGIMCHIAKILRFIQIIYAVKPILFYVTAMDEARAWLAVRELFDATSMTRVNRKSRSVQYSKQRSPIISLQQTELQM